MWKCLFIFTFFFILFILDASMVQSTHNQRNETQRNSTGNMSCWWQLIKYLCCRSNWQVPYIPGPSCSELTMLLVNESLNFTSSDTQICWNVCWKNVSSFCSAKATHIFSAKNIRILYIESAETVNKITLNKLVKLTMLWTTGPRSIGRDRSKQTCRPAHRMSTHPADFRYSNR